MVRGHGPLGAAPDCSGGSASLEAEIAAVSSHPQQYGNMVDRKQWFYRRCVLLRSELIRVASPHFRNLTVLVSGRIDHRPGPEAIALSLGACVIFRNRNAVELFRASRSRRRIDWPEVRAKFSAPTAKKRRWTLYGKRFSILDTAPPVKPANQGPAAAGTAACACVRGEKIWRACDAQQEVANHCLPGRLPRNGDCLFYAGVSVFLVVR